MNRCMNEQTDLKQTGKQTQQHTNEQCLQNTCASSQTNEYTLKLIIGSNQSLTNQHTWAMIPYFIIEHYGLTVNNFHACVVAAFPI